MPSLHDFGITARWAFFATSHGKSPCDGIGGTVKRLVARASKQRPLDDQILSMEKMLENCELSIKGIKFLKVTKINMTLIRPMLSTVACWQGGPGGAILGERKNEKGVPIPRQILKVGGKKRI